MSEQRPESSLERLEKAVRKDFREYTPQSLTAVEEALFDHENALAKPFKEKIKRIKMGEKP